MSKEPNHLGGIVIKKYRKKPIVIEAVQWTGDNADEILDWGSGHVVQETIPVLGRMMIATREESSFANIGNYLIKGIAGEFYLCDKDIFEQNYDPVD